MRLDLSSHITFERVPKKYYRPENAFEEYNLARFEKLPLAIFEESRKASHKIAKDIDVYKRQALGCFCFHGNVCCLFLGTDPTRFTIFKHALMGKSKSSSNSIKPGLFRKLTASIAKYSKAFWVANVVELLERLAYYAVFIVITLYLSCLLYTSRCV